MLIGEKDKEAGDRDMGLAKGNSGILAGSSGCPLVVSDGTLDGALAGKKDENGG